MPWHPHCNPSPSGPPISFAWLAPLTRLRSLTLHIWSSPALCEALHMLPVLNELCLSALLLSDISLFPRGRMTSLSSIVCDDASDGDGSGWGALLTHPLRQLKFECELSNERLQGIAANLTELRSIAFLDASGVCLAPLARLPHLTSLSALS